MSYDIYIEEGATLTVNSTLTMVSGVDIFVEDSSVLVLDGATITTDSCGEMWNGIDVAGEFDQGYYSPVIEEGELKRGKVILKNGALIEWAETAIDAQDRYIVGGKVFEHGGGRIDMRNSTIRECRYGIRLGRNGWGSVIGTSFQDAQGSFQDDQSFIDGSVFENNSIPIYSEYNIGLEIHNTRFRNNKGPDYEGYSSKIIADSDTFTRSIVMYSPNPVVPGSKITSSVFDSCSFETQSQGNFTLWYWKGTFFQILPVRS